MEKETVQICATIKIDTRDKVKKIADEKGWRFSQCVAHILDKEVKKPTKAK